MSKELAKVDEEHILIGIIPRGGDGWVTQQCHTSHTRVENGIPRRDALVHVRVEGVLGTVEYTLWDPTMEGVE